MSSLANAFWALALRAVDDDYPLVVHVPMSMISMCDYRKWREEEGEPRNWLFDLVCSSFTHSMGGGVGMMSLVEGGNPMHYFYTDADYAHVQLFCYLAGFWSPLDVVYRALTQPRNPLRLCCLTVGAFDSITTLFGLVDKCRSKFPRNRLLPVIAGVVLFKSGDVFASMVTKSKGHAPKNFLSHPDSGVARGALLAAAYWYFGHGFRDGKHRDTAVVVLAALYCFLELLEDLFDFDAFARAHALPQAFLATARRALHLGPPSASRAEAVVKAQ